jgi:ATP-binding protein involved in chromosome partitioning
MLTKLITEFLRNVEWGELDMLVLDLPPGPATCSSRSLQQLPLAGGVIVDDAAGRRARRRAARHPMFRR